MDEKEFQERLAKCLEAIKDMKTDNKTRESLINQAKETQARFAKSKEIVAKLTESIDLLRVHTKYLVFDLEATKRENAQLRKMLDSRGIDPDENET